MMRTTMALAILAMAIGTVCPAEEFMDDDGNPISAFMHSLHLDKDLYSMWRKNRDNPKVSFVLLNNRVAADRSRISQLILKNVHKYIQGHIEKNQNPPDSLVAMPEEERTCPVTLEPLLYFPTRAGAKDQGLVVVTIPSAIRFQSHDGITRTVVVLLGDGTVQEMKQDDFKALAIRNNAIRKKHGLPLMSETVIMGLAGKTDEESNKPTGGDVQ